MILIRIYPKCLVIFWQARLESLDNGYALLLVIGQFMCILVYYTMISYNNNEYFTMRELNDE